MSIEHLVRPNIWNLTPYTCARDEFKGEARAWLDANENARISGLNRYPDPLQWKLKCRLGEYRKVAPERIFFGVGSDECIDITYRTFCRPGVDNVVAIAPTYGMYQVCADINDVEYRSVSLGAGFSLDVEALLASTDEHTKVIWICSPNNPTANAFPIEQIKEVCERFGGITVVDEAYIDFSPAGSMVDWLDAYPRLIVMQTFSKAWASAAMRLGIAYASEEIIGIFNKVKYPYNINILTQERALSLLDNAGYIEEVTRQIVAARDVLVEQLSAVKVVRKIYPSDANFVLAEVDDAPAIYAYLRDNGVIVRNRNSVHLCAGCLRITVGTDEENELLIEKLKEYADR